MRKDTAGGDFPGPVVDIAVEPKEKADFDKLSVVLAHMAMGDASFRVHTDDESGQTIISGAGELHLDMLIERLRDEFGIGLNVGAAQVAYRETITKAVEHDYTGKASPRSAAQFAQIKFRIEPDHGSGKVAFVSAVVAGNIPADFIPAVERGVQSVPYGPVIGFPLIDVKFILLDGAYHDIDSSAVGFEAAGRAGLKEAVEKARPKVLEPIMAVEVVTPKDHLGDIVSDLNSRRGQMRGTEGRGIAQVVCALVPLATMFGYVNSLRSISQGRARYTMTFDHYAQVPDAVQPDDDPFGGAMAMRA